MSDKSRNLVPLSELTLGFNPATGRVMIGIPVKKDGVVSLDPEKSKDVSDDFYQITDFVAKMLEAQRQREFKLETPKPIEVPKEAESGEEADQ